MWDRNDHRDGCKQLVLGTKNNDVLSDANHYGNDCVVGGAGTDVFSGWKSHNDRCIVSRATQDGGIVSNCTVVVVRP